MTNLPDARSDEDPDGILRAHSVYDELDPETAAAARRSAEIIRRAGEGALSHMAIMGEELRGMQRRFSRKADGDGLFTRWLREEFNWSRQHAYNHIHFVSRPEYAALREANVHSNVHSPIAVVPQALFALGAGDRPYHQDARAELVERTLAGEHIGYRAAREILARHRAAGLAPPALDEDEDWQAPSQPGARTVGEEAAADLVAHPRIAQSMASRLISPSSGRDGDDQQEDEEEPSPAQRLLLRDRQETVLHTAMERTISLEVPQATGTQPPVVVIDQSVLAPHQAIHQSLTNEWYTPPLYVEAARAVLGGIDLDPASSDRANETVRAHTWFTLQENGLAQQWQGRVFLNPPYGWQDGESSAGIWAAKLLAEYDAGRVSAAVLLVNAVPGNSWFAPLWRFPICFTDHRISFIDAQGRVQAAPTHSNAFVYLGGDRSAFVSTFARFGAVVMRISTCDQDSPKPA